MATCDKPGDSCTSGPRRQPVRVVEEGPEGGCTQAFELLCCECGDYHDLDYRELVPEFSADPRAAPDRGRCGSI